MRYKTGTQGYNNSYWFITSTEARQWRLGGGGESNISTG